MHSSQCARGARRRPSAAPLPGPGQRRAARGLHGVQPRAADRRARRAPARRTRPSAPPPTCTKTRSSGAAGRCSAISQPMRAAAVEAQRVLRTLHAERHRAGGDRLPEAVDAGIARRVVVAPRADRDLGPQPVQRVHDGPDRPTAARTPRARPVGRGQRGRGQCGVPARGDGQAAARDRPTPSSSAALQVQQDRRAGGGPCGSRPRSPVSSFTHTPPSSVKPSASDSASARANGVTHEAGRRPPPATALVDLAHERGARRRRSCPIAAANACHASSAPNATNGLGSSTRPQRRRGRRTICSTWWRSVVGGVRAAPRRRRGDVDLGRRRRRSGSPARDGCVTGSSARRGR